MSISELTPMPERARRLSPFNGSQGSRLRAIFVAKTDQMADNLPHNPEHPGKDRFYPAAAATSGRMAMSSSAHASGLSPAEHRRMLTRAALAATIGTTIEWYDFYLYGTATGLVFG